MGLALRSRLRRSTWPFDPWGFHAGGERLHRWARAPVPLPSELLLWAQHELDSLQPTLATLQPTADSHDEDELDVIAAVVQGDEATWMADLEESLDTEAPQRAELERRWAAMSRTDKATARLLGFSFKTWHAKPWLVLPPPCDKSTSEGNTIPVTMVLIRRWCRARRRLWGRIDGEERRDERERVRGGIGPNVTHAHDLEVP